MENKTFGATLAELRKAKGWTQLDLADSLGVTDKAVSKWERDIALPEVENLIKISDIFGVSLDSLLRGEEFSGRKTSPEFRYPEPVSSAEAPFPPRKIVGTILLCFGAVVFLFITLFGDLLSGLLFASPFFLCGAVCMKLKKRIGLFCTWSVYICVCAYLGYAAGLNLGSLFSMTWVLLTKLVGLEAHVIIAWIMFLIFALLTLWTVLSFRKEPISRRKAVLILVVSGAVWAAIYLMAVLTAQAFAQSQMNFEPEFLRYFLRVVWSLKDVARFAAIAAFLTSLVNLISNRRKKIR